MAASVAGAAIEGIAAASLDEAPPARPLTVLTVNLCVLAPGLFNRQLPKLAQLGALLWALLAVGVAVWAAELRLWVGGLCLLPAYGLLLVLLAVPLGRLLGPVWILLGYDDHKRARLDLFLEALGSRPEWQDVDVICIQECFGTSWCSGRFPQRLAEGARAHGFAHAAAPAARASFPATLALNSGLMILSKRPIVATASKSFGFSLEATQVNRGALYAKLDNGLHVFTCHVTPPASITGDGPVSKLLRPFVEASRAGQMLELAHFIADCAPAAEPAVLAGDFNFDVAFDGFAAAARPPQHSQQAAAMLWEKCGLVEATTAVRGDQSSASGAAVGTMPPALALCRPTFGYTGDEGDGATAERWLSSFGSGKLHHSADDAAFFRGLEPLAVLEESLALPEAQRPGPKVTHLSDHWALRLTLRPLAGEPTSPASALPSTPRLTDETEPLQPLGCRS